MTNKYNKFWESKSVDERALYLVCAPKILTGWHKLYSDDENNHVESEYRLDIYTGNHFIAEVFYAGDNPKYSWHINNFYCTDHPACTEGMESSLVMAKKACDKALKEMGYILLK